MKSLTVCVTTSRKEPELDWIFNSLSLQKKPSDNIEMLVIDLNCEEYSKRGVFNPPKPNIWQGKYRLTKENWWAVSNARNTALCLCNTDWILFLDDRCVLQPGFMNAIRAAMDGNYIMCGAYEKRDGMTVKNGIVKHGGIIRYGTYVENGIIKQMDCTDSREWYCKQRNILMPFKCGGEWAFGCCLLMPLELALQVNGYPERCDSSSMEDVVFGLILQNNKFPIKYDLRAKIIEDRTPEFAGTQMRRESREKHSYDTNDRNHTTLRWVKTAMKSDNDFDIRELRARIQAGGQFDIPNNPDAKDWFDGVLVRNFV